MDEHEKRPEVLARLARIEGHVRGIRRMLEEEKPCDEVLLQLAAVRAALAGATRILLTDHFDHCIAGRNRDPGLEKELRDFRGLFERFLK